MSAAGPVGAQSMRVLSWNIWGLRGDQSALARVIRAGNADLVCLQEAPKWPGSRWELSALARRCGLLFVDGGRSAGGCALLADLRADVRSVSAFRLPVARRSDPSRGAVVAEVAPVGGQGCALAVVHLPLDAGQRVEHVGLVRRALGGLDLPRTLVAGDLNESPGGPVWAAWAPDCADPLDSGVGGSGSAGDATFPAREPSRRIDAILAGGLDVLEYDTWRADEADVRSASDHRPVLAVVAVPRR